MAVNAGDHNEDVLTMVPDGIENFKKLRVFTKADGLMFAGKIGYIDGVDDYVVVADTNMYISNHKDYARLMAAAPDLLKALSDFLLLASEIADEAGYVDKPGLIINIDSIIHSAREAISKAIHQEAC